MGRQSRHSEAHRVARVGWLRAAVLGANDGLLSTGSLILGVAAASTGRPGILITGVAGLVAGSMAMAAGEFVSVSSQSDAERADLAREKRELSEDGEAEHRELSAIYERRGVSPDVAAVVATQLMAKDALGAHALDELGISAATAARPIQAALASAASFAVGGSLPLLLVVVSPTRLLTPLVAGASLAFLTALGAVGAKAGGANPYRAMLRVTFWGAIAMGVTAAVGRIFGAVTG